MRFHILGKATPSLASKSCAACSAASRMAGHRIRMGRREVPTVNRWPVPQRLSSPRRRHPLCLTRERSPANAPRGQRSRGRMGTSGRWDRKGETPEQAARRETEEEAGYSHEGGLSPFMHSERDGVVFDTFLAQSTDKFKPELNNEHDGAVWIKPSEAEKKLPCIRACARRWRNSVDVLAKRMAVRPRVCRSWRQGVSG